MASIDPADINLPLTQPIDITSILEAARRTELPPDELPVQIVTAEG
jgi:hypothetical protein